MSLKKASLCWGNRIREKGTVNEKQPPKKDDNKYISVKNYYDAPIKRHRVMEWIRNQAPSISCLKETHAHWKWRDGETFIMQMVVKRTPG